MEEDEKTARLREQLRVEIDKLSEAMGSINSLETSSDSAATQEAPTYDPVEEVDEILDDEEV
jgi:hypothetical protein